MSVSDYLKQITLAGLDYVDGKCVTFFFQEDDSPEIFQQITSDQKIGNLTPTEAASRLIWEPLMNHSDPKPFLVFEGIMIRDRPKVPTMFSRVDGEKAGETKIVMQPLSQRFGARTCEFKLNSNDVQMPFNWLALKLTEDPCKTFVSRDQKHIIANVDMIEAFVLRDNQMYITTSGGHETMIVPPTGDVHRLAKRVVIPLAHKEGFTNIGPAYFSDLKNVEVASANMDDRSITVTFTGFHCLIIRTEKQEELSPIMVDLMNKIMPQKRKAPSGDQFAEPKKKKKKAPKEKTVS